MAQIRYIALLRGINIGSHNRIKMADLRQMMQDTGYSRVKTARATGNIAFDAPQTDPATLEAAIAQAITDTFGFAVPVIVRQQTAIQALIARDPFADVDTTDSTRLYVICLPDNPDNPPMLPYHTDTGSFTLLSLADRFVCSRLNLDDTRTTEAMRVLKTLFGDRITTRNWNTILTLQHL